MAAVARPPIATLSAAIGALAAAIPAWLSTRAGIEPLAAIRWLFALYALVGLLTFALYRRLPEAPVEHAAAKTPLGPSRRVVFKLAALFSVDAFAGGLIHGLARGMAMGDALQCAVDWGAFAVASESSIPSQALKTWLKHPH
mgnify:CR=1 FL=1